VTCVTASLFAIDLMSDFTLKLHREDDDEPTAPPQQIVRAEAHGTRWLWIEDAAHLLGLKNVGTLRNKCLSTWERKLLARKAKRDNGQVSWQISELADSRLMASVPASPMKATADEEWGKLSDERREIVLRTENYLQNWQRQISAGLVLGLKEDVITKMFVEQARAAGFECSRRSLYRWQADFRSKGRLGLFDPRWKVVSAATANDLHVYRDTLTRLYLDQRKRSISQCHYRAVEASERAGETPPTSTKTAQRIVNAIARDTVMLLREGEDAYKDNIAKHIRRDYSTIDSNDWWCSDHFCFDVIVRTPDGELARPWLHAWMDVRSRKIVGYAVVLHDPNTDLILRVFAQAVRSHGVPRHVYIDNGKDYDAKALQGVTKKQRRSGVNPGDLTPADIRRVGGAFTQLSIDVVHCWPYHGQAKPNERFHRRINDQFSRDFASYTGGDTTKKPEDLAEKLAADQIPLMSDFVAAFDDWMAGYHSIPHMGDSMDDKAPEIVFEECLVSRRTVPDELLRLACMTRHECVIRQNGVHFQSISWHHSDLDKRFGEKVQIAIDVDDLSNVIVLDKDGRVICRAKANVKLPFGADKQMLRDAIAEQRRTKKAAKNYHEARPKMAMDPVDLMRSSAAKRGREHQEQVAKQTGTDSIPPASISPVRTPFDDQREALSKAFHGPRPVGPQPANFAEPTNTGFLYVPAARSEDE
jgi:hypothetical protein